MHVTIDTTLQNQSLAIKAYISRALLLAEKQLATEFVQVDCEVKTADLGSLGGAVPSSLLPFSKPVLTHAMPFNATLFFCGVTVH